MIERRNINPKAAVEAGRNALRAVVDQLQSLNGDPKLITEAPEELTKRAKKYWAKSNLGTQERLDIFAKSLDLNGHQKALIGSYLTHFSTIKRITMDQDGLYTRKSRTKDLKILKKQTEERRVEHTNFLFGQDSLIKEKVIQLAQNAAKRFLSFKDDINPDPVEVRSKLSFVCNLLNRIISSSPYSGVYRGDKKI